MNNQKGVRDLIIKEIEANPQRYLNGNYAELGEKYGLDKTTVRNYAYEYRKGKNIKIEEKKVSEWTVEKELETRKENALAKVQAEKIKKLTKELESYQSALDSALNIKAETEYDSSGIKWNGKHKEEAVVIAQFSDWHVGKRIDRKTMNGLNEYNPSIAEKRAKAVTSNLLKLVKKERQDVKVDNLIVNLGGDFVQNFLHESDPIQNYLSPLEEVRFAKHLIGSSLKTIAEYGDFKKITLLCTRGNHPRMTKRMEAEVDYKMNLEAMMYYILSDDFSDKLFEWSIEQSDLAYYQVGNYNLRYFHGHQIGFQGGIGGLTIPLNKKIMYWDQTTKADWNLISHWHTFSMPTKTGSVNGAMCGYDPYAQSCGFKFEPPIQAFQLLDKKRGFTGRFPIQCE